MSDNIVYILLSFNTELIVKTVVLGAFTNLARAALAKSDYRHSGRYSSDEELVVYCCELNHLHEYGLNYHHVV